MNPLIQALQNVPREWRMDRRQLLKGLGAATAAAAWPSRAAASAEFHSTSVSPFLADLKATWVNHYTYIAPDLNKTADWYMEVFGMQKGHSDSRQVHLWFGDTGGDALMIVRQANVGEQAPGLEKMAFTIENWDQGAVEAELKRRGLHPITDTDRGFWFHDLEGNEIGVFAKDFMTRPAAPPTTPTLWKAVSVNHIQLISGDNTTLAPWYKDLLNMSQNPGGANYLWFGDSIVVTNGGLFTDVRLRGGEGRSTSASLKRLDHAAYTIENYDHAAVEAELTRRGLRPREDFALSYNCVDINGAPTQVCDIGLVPLAERIASGN